MVLLVSYLYNAFLVIKIDFGRKFGDKHTFPVRDTTYDRF